MIELPRAGLASRIALLVIGCVLITGVIAGVLATNLIRSAGTTSARKALRQLATVSQTVAGDASTRAQVRRVDVALQGLNGIGTGGITPDGRIRTDGPRAALVRRSLTGRDVARVLAGADVSTTHNGVLVEARPTSNGGGVVLVQRRTDAIAQQERAVRRIVVALVVAGAIALLLGFVVAWRLARPLRRTAAAAHSMVLGNRDVALAVTGPSEVAEVSSAINALADALGRSEARQREFLLSVSHDLRTPLTGISGYAESLADGTVPPQDAAHAGEVMLGEARRLERLVADLLDLARLDARDLRLEPIPTDLVELARGAGRVWADRCAGAGVEFRAEASPGPLPCITDPERVRQVLDGLFDNALRVTPAGASIVLAVRAEPGAAIVEVRDGGPGLTDDDLQVAFEQGELYRRYRGVREVGTGLGLAIVARLVARLGGTCEAGHAMEGGARFTVRLPA